MNPKMILYFLFLTTTITNFAQGKLLGEGTISQKTYYDEIPFVIENGLMIIPVKIAKQNYRFLFDTGAPNTLNSAVFQNLKKISSLPISDSNINVENLQIVHIPVFQIGNLQFDNYNFLEYDFTKNSIFNCLNFDGIIGSNSFSNSVIRIDYRNKILVISNEVKKLNISSKAHKLQILGGQKAPFIQIKMSGKHSVYDNALFDTGYRNFYLQSNRAFKIFTKEKVFHDIVTSKSSLSVGLFGSDSITEKSIFRIPNFSLASIKFQDVVAYSSDDTNSKIGNELLNYGVITLDFIKSKYYFDNYQNTTALDKDYPLFASSSKDGYLIIGMVIHPELAKMINVGDIIVSIDDFIFSKDGCEIITASKVPKEKFKVLQDGKQIEILVSDYQ